MKLLPWLGAAFNWLLRGLITSFISLRSGLVFVVYLIFETLIPKILLALGIGFVTYNLGSYGLDSIYNLITDQLSTLPADILAMFKLAKIDEFLSIIFGAFTARLTLAGLGVSGNIRKFGFTRSS